MTGQVAEGVVGDNMPPTSAVSPAARSQLEAIRDEWLQPLIDQLREAERTIGRLEAERDALRVERDTLRVGREDAPVAHEREPTAHERREAFWHAPAGAPTTLRAMIRRLIGR
jgi:hypothetical protein